MSKSLLWLSCMVPLLVLGTGCGNGMYRVRGKVHFADGTPLDQGKVLLSSTTGPHGASSKPLAKDGSFILGSKTASDGVPPGEYRLSILGGVEPPVGEAAMMGPKKYLIHPRYEDPVQSGLTFEVKPINDNFLDITVEKPPSTR
jgi:hypothetical protein